MADKLNNSLILGIRERLANNINPFNYDYLFLRALGTVVFNRQESGRTQLDPKYYPRLAAWSKYLNTPVKEIPNLDNYIIESKYKPSLANNQNTVYYTYKPQRGLSILDVYRQTSGNYTIGVGEDLNGKYYSLYDKWDLNPLDARSNSKDISMGIGTPFEVYDRVYESTDPNNYKELLDAYNSALLIFNPGKKEGDNVVYHKSGGRLNYLKFFK